MLALAPVMKGNFMKMRKLKVAILAAGMGLSGMVSGLANAGPTGNLCESWAAMCVAGNGWACDQYDYKCWMHCGGPAHSPECR